MSPIQIPALRKELSSKAGVTVSSSSLRLYLREILQMRYKRVHQITINHNKWQNKVKRQHAAAEYIELLDKGWRIISLDESVLRTTDQRSRGWIKKGTHNFVSLSQRLASTNIIAAISDRGEKFFTINRGRTNSKTFILFLSKLISHLDQVDQNWRRHTRIMLDNAPYHRSKEVAEFIQAFSLPVFFLGPYQFTMAPIEMFFSYIKSRDLNPKCLRVNNKQGLAILNVKIGKIGAGFLEKSHQPLLSCQLTGSSHASSLCQLQHLRRSVSKSSDRVSGLTLKSFLFNILLLSPSTYRSALLPSLLITHVQGKQVTVLFLLVHFWQVSYQHP